MIQCETVHFRFSLVHTLLVVLVPLSGVPDAPGTPEFTDKSPSFITLTWTAPNNDGGTPVTGYILETKGRFMSRWTRVTRDQITETTFKVTNVKQDEEYQYRVIAINKKGESEPSKPSDVIKATFPFGETLTH